MALGLQQEEEPFLRWQSEAGFRGSPGSLLTAKGEDSEEDEDTEYFDAMEDSTSFITVITEASEDRWASVSRAAHCHLAESPGVGLAHSVLWSASSCVSGVSGLF